MNKKNDPRNEKGFAFIAIIMIVVIIFSVLLVSGAEKFELSVADPPTQEASSSTEGDPTPTIDPEASAWDIKYSIETCENGTATGTITAVGSVNGYITLERQQADGSFELTSSDIFESPSDTAELLLQSTDGYSTNSWRLKLFEGGSGTKDNYSGGVERADIDGEPTGCS